VLLDPQDILLNTSAQPAPPNNGIGVPDVAFADPPDPGTYTIQISDVTGYAELYLQATRDITVANPLAMAAGNTIRLEANNNININAAVSTSGTPSTARPSITLTLRTARRRRRCDQCSAGIAARRHRDLRRERDEHGGGNDYDDRRGRAELAASRSVQLAC
jgi:hypothetical protein